MTQDKACRQCRKVIGEGDKCPICGNASFTTFSGLWNFMKLASVAPTWEMSEFWQNKQCILQPIVPIERIFFPG